MKEEILFRHQCSDNKSFEVVRFLNDKDNDVTFYYSVNGFNPVLELSKVSFKNSVSYHFSVFINGVCISNQILDNFSDFSFSDTQLVIRNSLFI